MKVRHLAEQEEALEGVEGMAAAEAPALARGVEAQGEQVVKKLYHALIVNL